MNLFSERLGLIPPITSDEIQLREESEALKTRVEQLTKENEAMRADFATLNEIYNVQANKHRWCSTYECNQNLYNRRLTILKLQPRPQYAHYYASCEESIGHAYDGSYTGSKNHPL